VINFTYGIIPFLVMKLVRFGGNGNMEHTFGERRLEIGD
jgi:hypothetical protein